MTLPVTPSEVAHQVLTILGDGRPRDEDDLVTEVLDAGLGPESQVEDLVYDALESDDLPGVVYLLDGRLVSVAGLLGDRTLTHRLRPAEVEHGYLVDSPDLAPLAVLTDADNHFQLVDGTLVLGTVVGYDDVLAERGIDPADVGDGVWLLAPSTLTDLGLAGGDLLGVTVRADGLELSRVDDGAPSTGAAAALRDVVERHAVDHPVEISAAVWTLATEHPGLFEGPMPPFTEMLDEADLASDGELIAAGGFDFGRWRADHEVARLRETFRLEEDEAWAVLALTSVYDRVADLLDAAQQTVEEGGSLEELFDEPETDTHPGSDPGAGPDRSPDDDDDTRAIIRDTLPLLAEPRIAEALVIETMGAGDHGAPALGLFAETLEEQAPRAAKAPTRWMRGRALDRMGNVVEAEQAFEAAVTLDDTFGPALFDLARIASDRGNAERGLSLLRRAGAPEDDDLVVLLQHFRPTERTDIGRNDRCWCGSGRKYKVCHRGKESLPLEDRAAWLYQKAGAYLSDGPWRVDVLDAAVIRSAHWDGHDALFRALDDGLVTDTVLFEGGAFAAFLEDRGVLLPDDELLLAQQWLLAERSVHEIETVSPGRGFTARDVRTGERVEVREHTASRTVKSGMLVCARLVPAGDTVQCFGGLEPVPLHQRDDLVALLDGEPDPTEVVEFLSRRFAPPTLQNTEGHSLVFCESLLEVTDPARLAAALDAAFERVEGEHRWHEETPSHGMPQISAVLELEDAGLRVETNSEQRMARVLDRLEDLYPGLEILDQTRKPAADVQDEIERNPSRPPAAALDASDPEIAALLADVIRRHETAWLDESIPALAGVTPREAAADQTRRADLIKLLDSFPTDPDNPGMMSPERLRAALGLDG